MSQNDNPIPQPTPFSSGSLIDIPDHAKRVIREILIIILLFVIGGTAILLWFKHLAENLPRPEVGVHVIAQPAKEVASISKARAPVKNGAVSVYASQAKIKLDLPKPIMDDQAEQVLASSQVKSDDHPQTITTTINTETGESQTFVRRDPLPWIAWDDHGDLGLYGGLKNGTPTARLEVQQGIFQVKAVHVGVVATVDQPIQGPLGADYFVGVGAWYKW